MTIVPDLSLELMACQALRIIERRTTHKTAVRIVARQTTDARVSGAPAAALLKPVGLKAHVAHVEDVHQLDLGPGSMTGAAEVVQIVRGQPAGIEHRSIVRAPALNAGDVLCARPM